MWQIPSVLALSQAEMLFICWNCSCCDGHSSCAVSSAYPEARTPPYAYVHIYSTHTEFCTVLFFFVLRSRGTMEPRVARPKRLHVTPHSSRCLWVMNNTYTMWLRETHPGEGVTRHDTKHDIHYFRTTWSAFFNSHYTIMMFNWSIDDTSSILMAYSWR